MKVIIDTDPGQDDAIALLMACQSSHIEVMTVTTVCGNSTIENTTRNARFLMQSFSGSDALVYSGAATPLRRPLVQATVHGTSGLEGIDPIGDPGLTNNAVDKILQLIGQNPGEITILAIGPLTNIAQAIMQDPDTMTLVKEIIAMAGAIDVPGNMPNNAEFNVSVDPEAAEVVLASGLPLTLLPLDTCNEILLPLSIIEMIKDSALRQILHKMLAPYTARIKEDTGNSTAIIYDAAVPFYLLKPQLCSKVLEYITINQDGVMSRASKSKGVQVGVVRDINSKDFTDLFLQLVNN